MARRCAGPRDERIRATRAVRRTCITAFEIELAIASARRGRSSSHGVSSAHEMQPRKIEVHMSESTRQHGSLELGNRLNAIHAHPQRTVWPWIVLGLLALIVIAWAVFRS
jgi:hypothetical protein